MTAHAASDAHSGMHHAHVSSAATLVKVLVSLLILTILTVAVSRVDFGHANLAIALIIAIVKMSLVLTWFMHLKGDTATNTLFILGSFVFLSLLFLFTLVDHGTRGHTDPLLVDTAPLGPLPGS